MSNRPLAIFIIYLSICLFIHLFILRQGLAMQLRLSWNSLCIPV
jgi:hypothetical protein